MILKIYFDFRSYNMALPSLIFGSMALAACFTATLLPETKGLVLEEDLEGAAKQAKANSNQSSNRFSQLTETGDEEEEE